MADPSTHSGSDNSGSRSPAPAHRNISPGRLGDVRTVLELIAKHDGEVAQADVVAETGWSEAKTCQVVQISVGLGLVIKFDAGRRNYLYRPETAPSDAERLARMVQEDEAQ